MLERVLPPDPSGRGAAAPQPHRVLQDVWVAGDVGSILEGSLAGFFVCHATALGFGCGADFSLKLMRGMVGGGD